MKFITYKNGSKFNLAIIAKDGSVVDFKEAGIKFSDMSEFIINHSADDIKKLQKLSLQGGGALYESVQKRAPIVTPRQDIICLGLNYIEHAKESYRYKNQEFDGKRDEPVYFSKRVNKAVGDGESIDVHANLTKELDYEAELAIIIGKDAKSVSQKEAKNYIFGYTIINDISARDVQTRHKQWYFGKSLDESTSMGPYIITKDELDSSNLYIRSYVNGELRQSSNTSLMIFNESFVIAQLSAGMSLKAGTIIAMGTPSGVGMGFKPPKFLKAGDEVVCEIEGICSLRNCII